MSSTAAVGRLTTTGQATHKVNFIHVSYTRSSRSSDNGFDFNEQVSH